MRALRWTLLLALGAEIGAGAPILVTTLADTDVPEGACSLREAIVAAETDLPYQDCAAGAGTDTLRIVPDGTITLLGPLPVITTSLSVVGGGENRTTIDGDHQFRIFDVDQPTFASVEIAFRSMTLRGGFAADDGGCIRVSGCELVELNRIRAIDCEATDDGGAFHDFATDQVVIRHSLFANNVAGSSGGAIYQFNFGALTLEDSTIADNQAAGAGGVQSGPSGLTMRRSTITGNTAQGSAGGVSVSGPARIEHSTIAGNTAGANQTSGDGGGVSVPAAAQLTIVGSIVAGNLDLAPSALTRPDFALTRAGGSSISSEGFNLVGDHHGVEPEFPASSPPQQPNVNGDFVGTEAAPIDPELGALGFQGGATPTRMPQGGSPAVDRSRCPLEAADQRGFGDGPSARRAVDDPVAPNFADGCDIGAVERGGVDLSGLLLGSDFEEGDTSEWSATVP